MEYLGFRARLTVSFGKMQDKIQVDIGVGDLVNWDLSDTRATGDTDLLGEAQI